MRLLRFLRETWIWWLAPIVLLLGALALLLFLAGDDTVRPFHYNL
jgi:hypothetical protein